MQITTVFLDLYQTLAYFHPPRDQRYSLTLREFGFEAELSAIRRAYLAADQFYTTAGMETPVYRLSSEQRDQVYLRFHHVLLEELGLGHAIPMGERIRNRFGEFERRCGCFPTWSRR